MALDDDDAEDEDDPADLSKVAAYNLCNLYVLVGNAELAKEVAEEWLAV
jgi:hypothetical protein